MHLRQQLHDLPAHLVQVRINLLQRPRRHVLVEVPVEGDLIADDAHQPVLRIGLGLVDPGIGYVGQHFTLEVIVDVFAQRHVLVVAQVGVRFNLAAALADFCIVVVFAQVFLQQLEGRRG